MDAEIEKSLNEFGDTIDQRMAEIRRLREENKVLLEAAKSVLIHVEDMSVERVPSWQCTLCATYRKLLRDAIRRCDATFN
jgi:hypothetical protein